MMLDCGARNFVVFAPTTSILRVARSGFVPKTQRADGTVSCHTPPQAVLCSRGISITGARSRKNEAHCFFLNHAATTLLPFLSGPGRRLSFESQGAPKFLDSQPTRFVTCA